MLALPNVSLHLPGLPCIHSPDKLSVQTALPKCHNLCQNVKVNEKEEKKVLQKIPRDIVSDYFDYACLKLFIYSSRIISYRLFSV